jgi:hypothetical protein
MQEFAEHPRKGYDLRAIFVRPDRTNMCPMTKRLVAGGLWALAVYSAAEVAAGMLGVADPFGLILGLAVGSLIAYDPTGRIWGAAPRRRTVRIQESAAPSDVHSAPVAR